MPGGDLLFQRLSVSTIGADWFHGRVREGIGWFTDAMATRQWSRRIVSMHWVHLFGMDFAMLLSWLVSSVIVGRDLQGQACH